MKYYKKVVDNYPSSPQVKDAMIGIKNIYVDKNDVDTYFAFAKQSGIETNVTVVERDSLSFMAANRGLPEPGLYAALPLMDNYLRQYPQGLSGGCCMRSATVRAGWKPCGGRWRLWRRLWQHAERNRYQSLALKKAAAMQMEG